MVETSSLLKLVEALDKVPQDKQETVVAHILGVIHGMTLQKGIKESA